MIDPKNLRSINTNRSNREEMMDWRHSIENECDLCQGTDFIDDEKTGETICTTCGYVVSTRNIDQGKDWRAFTMEDERSKARTGLPISPLIPDKGLTTRVGRLRRGSPEQIAKANRLQKVNQRNRGSNIERNLRRAFDMMDIICATIGINNNARERSAIVYRKAVERKLSRGRPMDALICACLFTGCKNNETPKPLEEFSRFADERQVKNCIALLVDEMKLNITASYPKEFVQEIAEKGCITNNARMNAFKILDRLELIGISMLRDPRGLAAAALYIGCKASKTETDRIQTQRDMAVYAGLTEVTVRNRIQDIKSVLIIKMPEDPLDTLQEETITV